MSHPSPLPTWRMLTYASGNFGKNLLWGTIDLTLMFLLTDRLGLSPAAAGLMVFGSLLLDAALYPVAGRLADRLALPLGRYGALIAAGAPIATAGFILLFALSQASAAVWLVAMALALFRLGYVMLDLGHNALLTVLSAAARDNGQVAISRFLFSSLATLTLAFAVTPLIAPVASAGTGTANATPAIAIALVAAGVVIVSWRVVRTFETRDRAGPADGFGNIRLLLQDRGCRLALIAGAAATLFLPLYNKACLYFATYLAGDAELVSPLLTALVIGQVAGLPLWLYLSPRWPKPRSMQLAHGLCVTGFLGAGAAFLLAPGQPLFLLGGTAVAGMGLSGVYALIWALLSDCAASLHDRTGLTMGGQLFAWAILLQKAAMGVGAAGFGLALDGTGYTGGSPPDLARSVIFAFAFVLPALGGGLCLFVLGRLNKLWP